MTMPELFGCNGHGLVMENQTIQSDVNSWPQRYQEFPKPYLFQLE